MIMIDKFERTKILLGDESMKRLSECRVAVFGVGGVGGYVCEALARSGIGQIDLIDNDRVCYTNLNRQIIALNSTIGRYKVDVMADRIRDINPDCIVNVHKTFYLPPEARSMKQLSVSTNASDTDRNKGQTENGNASDDTDKKITGEKFNFATYDYVVDAIDTVTGKIGLIVECSEAGTPIISSMGAGNKLDPSAFEVSDIYKTSVDPLARVMRRELKKRGIRKLKVVYSKEEPVGTGAEGTGRRRRTPGSIAFVPSVCGLIIAGEVIRDLSDKS
jgi:tRNA A37 threonylcarbamoyladenosine dehydratase